MTRHLQFRHILSVLFLMLTCPFVQVTMTAEPLSKSPSPADQTQPLSVDQISSIQFGDAANNAWQPHKVTLAPAKWIWLPSERTLPNTFVLFRKELTLKEQPVSARGWITADSRYRLTVNGQRVQWGPAPCDPRQWDVDPVDITRLLQSGKNVIGVEVLYYGIGEGTWAAGKPGLLFHAVLKLPDGGAERIVSDESWQCLVDRAHPPAQPKRWFLRALQEVFDAREHPYGWDAPEYSAASASWVSPMVLACPADKPPSCSPYQTTDSIDLVRVSHGALREADSPGARGGGTGQGSARQRTGDLETRSA